MAISPALVVFFFSAFRAIGEGRAPTLSTRDPLFVVASQTRRHPVEALTKRVDYRLKKRPLLQGVDAGVLSYHAPVNPTRECEDAVLKLSYHRYAT
jgi:hypothetical protein